MNRLVHDIYSAHDVALTLDTTLNLGSALTCNFNSNGQLLFIGTSTGDVLVFDMYTKFPVARLPPVSGSVISVSSTLDQQWVLSTSTNGVITRYHLPTLSIDKQIQFPSPIQWSQIAPNNKDICIVSPLSPCPSCIINFALEVPTYNQLFNFEALPKQYDLSRWINSIPSRANLTTIPTLLDPYPQIKGSRATKASATGTKRKKGNVEDDLAADGDLGTAETTDLASTTTTTTTIIDPPGTIQLPSHDTTVQYINTNLNAIKHEHPLLQAERNITQGTFQTKLPTDTLPLNPTGTIPPPEAKTRKPIAEIAGFNAHRLSRTEYITLASFSSLGDKIAFASTRGRAWVADVSYLSELEMLQDVNLSHYVENKGERSFLPFITIDDDIAKEYPLRTDLGLAGPQSSQNLSTMMKKYKIVFANGLVLTNIISLSPPRGNHRLVTLTSAVQIQFSNQPLVRSPQSNGLDSSSPTAASSELFVAVCSDTASIVYDATTGAYNSHYRHTVADVTPKKTVFSHRNNHVYTIFMNHSEHEIHVRSLEKDGVDPIILQGPSESSYDICAHPILPVIVTIPATGRICFWSSRTKESWTAFNPVFQELEDNVEYVEREDEFDLKILPTHQGNVQKGYSVDYLNNNIEFNAQVYTLNNYSNMVEFKPVDTTENDSVDTTTTPSPADLTTQPVRFKTCYTICHDVPNCIRPKLPLAIERDHFLGNLIATHNQHKLLDDLGLECSNVGSLVNANSVALSALGFLPPLESKKKKEEEEETLARPVNASYSHAHHKNAEKSQIRDLLRKQYEIQLTRGIPPTEMIFRGKDGFILPKFFTHQVLQHILTLTEQDQYLTTKTDDGLPTPLPDPLLLSTLKSLSLSAHLPRIDQTVAMNNLSSGMGAAVMREFGMNNMKRIDSETTLGRGAGVEQKSDPIYTLQHIAVKKILAETYPTVHGMGIQRDNATSVVNSITKGTLAVQALLDPEN